MSLIVHGNHEKGYVASVSQNPNKPTNNFKENYNISEADEWLKKHEEKYLPALNELLGKIERISYVSFVDQLKLSLQDTLTQLGVDSPQKYTDFLDRAVVLVEHKKSNQWVAEIARRKLGFKPKKYYRLGSKDANKFVDHINGHAGSAEKNELKNKVIVLFDDGSYSGKQMTDHVKALLKLKKKLKFDKICVIVPYMTDHAKSGLEETVIKTHNVGNVVIADAAKIATVAESVTPENKKLLTELWWNKEEVEEGANSKGVIWFDHKVPNDQSFIGAIEKGNVINTKKVCKQIFGILPNIVVPYKV